MGLGISIGFLDETADSLLYVNEYGYYTIKYFNDLGFVNVQTIKDKRRVSSYVTKYISKNIGKGINIYKHSYFCSKGLSRGLEVFTKLYDNDLFNIKFFDFRNDYCCKSILTEDAYRSVASIFSML